MRHHVKVENMRIKEAELKELLKSMERMEFEAEAEEEIRNGLSKDWPSRICESEVCPRRGVEEEV